MEYGFYIEDVHIQNISLAYICAYTKVVHRQKMDYIYGQLLYMHVSMKACIYK